jgi:hypothetical protein
MEGQLLQNEYGTYCPDDPTDFDISSYQNGGCN